jgi:Ca-activated chloride channel family protein
VGPNSSLIVLELASDYARYSLPAPPELADEVARLSQQQFAQVTQTRQAHIEAMVRQFDEKQRWWERDFPKEAARRVEPKAEMQVSQGALGGLAATARLRESREQAKAVPMPAPSFAPMPVAPAAAAPSAAPAMSAATASARAADTDNRSAKSAAAAPSSTIALQAWVPDAPYMKRLQDAGKDDLYRVYLDERAAWLSSSSFYMDAAGVFFERGLPELGLRVLSNLAEMNLENRQLLRLYAYRLLQARRSDLAVPVFERISELAPNEPQSWRDLGLALAESGQPQRAVNALWEVVSQPWNGRFAGINMIALAELNAIAAQAASSGQPALDLGRVDTRLRRNLPLALRVVMAWDSDDTDIDMWVIDPNGERASYANRLSYQGGAMSPDATGGYGPEEFSLKAAKPGKYGVEAQFYGQRQQVLSAGTTVMVRVTTGFGTPQARDEWTTLRLTRGQETVRVAEVEVR